MNKKNSVPAQMKALRWATKKDTGPLVLFIQGNAERAALKLTDPDTHDLKLQMAKAVVESREKRGY